MSSHVDERVVEMRFENAQFEKGVAQTMTSLEKLNDSLKFEGAEKSFNELQRSANLFTLSNIEENVDSLSNSFSVLGVMGMTALNRITNSAITMGANLVKSLSFGQMQAGFAKYEKDLQAVQMIMNATGESIEYVEDNLKTLTWYTDETSYDYAGMVDTIAKFTSAGVDLEDAVPMIIGIANACGLAGVNAQQANHAFEGLSRAVGQGFLNRNNWMWVKTSGLANNIKFKDTIIQTAEAFGTLHKVEEDLWIDEEGHEVTLGSFDQNLKDQWVTAEVLTDVFKQYGEDTLALKEFVDAHEEFDTASEALEAYSDQMSELGYQSFKASQVARTFTDAINATKDAASTQWMTTYKYLFGNFEEASVMWTRLSNELWEIFVQDAYNRNKDLFEPWVKAGGRDSFVAGLFNIFEALKNTIMEVKAAFGTLFPSINVDTLLDWTYRFEAFTEKIRDAFTAIYDRTKPVRDVFDTISKGVQKASKAQNEFSDSVEKTVKPLKDLTEVANQVIYGTYGNGADRVKALTEAGYVYEDVQDKVNELLGCEFRYNKQHEETNESLDATAEHAQTAEEAIRSFMDKLRPTRSYSTLDNIISTLRGLIAIARILKNAVTAVFRIIKPGLALILKMGDAVLGVTGTLGDFLEMIADYIEDNDLIYNGLKKITDIFAKAFSPMFEKVRRFLEYLADRRFIDDLLDKFDEFNEKTGFTEKAAGALKIVFGAIEKVAEGVATAFATIVSVIANSPLLTGLVNAFTVILNFLVGLKQQFIDPAWNFVKNVLAGFVASLTNIFGILNPIQIAVKILTGLLVILGGAIAAVIAPFALFIHAFVNSKAFEYIKTGVAALIELFKQLYTQFAAPALQKVNDKFVEFAERVKNSEFTIENFLATFKGALTWATERLINSKLVWPFQALFRSKEFNNGYNAVYKWASTVKTFLETMIKGGKDAEGVSNRLKATKTLFEQFSNSINSALSGPLSILGKFRDKVVEVINAIKKSFEGKSISDIIDSILTKSRLVAYIATLITLTRVFKNLGDVFGGVSGFVRELGYSFKNWNNFIKTRTILNVAVAIGILAGSLYLLSKADPKGLDKARDALLSISIIMGVIVGIMAWAASKSTKDIKVGKEFFQMTLGFIALAGTLLIVAIAISIFSKFDFGSMVKAGAYMIGVLGVMIAVMFIMSKMTFKTDPAKLFFALTSMFIFAVAMQKVVDVLVQLASMDTKDIDDNLVTLAKIMLILGGLMFAASKLTSFSGVGMLLMVASLYLFLRLLERIEQINLPNIIASLEDYQKIGWMLVALAGILFIAGKGGVSVAATIMAMAFAVALFAKVIKELANIKEEDLRKGMNIMWELVGIVAAFLVVATICKVMSAKAGAGRKGAFGSTVGPIMALIIGLIALAGLLVALGWLYNNHKDLIDAGMGIMTVITFFLSALLLCAAAAKGAAPAVLSMVALFGLIIVAFYVLDKLDPDKARQNAWTLAIVIGALAVALAMLALLAGPLGAAAGVLTGFVGVMVGLAALIGLIVGTIVNGVIQFTSMIDYIVESVGKTADMDGAAIEANLGHIANGLKSFAEVFTAYGIDSLFEKDVIKNIADSINTLVPFIEIAKDLTLVLDQDGNIVGGQANHIKMGLQALADGFAAFGETMKSYGWFSGGAAEKIKTIADAIAVLAPNLNKVANVNGEKFSKNMATISDAFVKFGTSSTTTTTDEGTQEYSKKKAEAIKILAEAVTPLLESVPDIVALDTDAFASGMEAIGNAFIALGTALGDPKIGDVFSDSRANGIATLAGSLGTLGTGVKTFIENIGELDIENDVKPALTGIGEGLASFAGAFKGSGMFDTTRADAIATLSSSIGELGRQTKKFVQYDTDGTFTDLLPHIGSAFESFGTAIHNAGGFLTDAERGANSIITLMSSLEDFIPTLVEYRKEFGGGKAKGVMSITDIFTSLGEGMQAMADLANSALTPEQQNGILVFFDPLGDYIGDLANSIMSLKTYLTSDFVELFKDFVGVITSYNTDNAGSGLTEAVTGFIGSITTAITDSAETLQGAGAIMGMHIIAGITSEEEMLPSYVNAAQVLISAFIEGMNSMDEQVKASGSHIALTAWLGTYRTGNGEGAISTYESFKRSGAEAAQGFIDGLISPEKLDAAFNAGVTLANAALEGLNSVEGLDVNSPSKKARKSGVSTAEGLVMGMRDMMSAVAQTGAELGNAVFGPLNYYTQAVADSPNENINDNLVITPILDLSQVQNGANRLSGLLAQNSMISANAINNGFSQNGGVVGGGIVFNQYNNSPKALSQIDIYRQTRNQLSAAKGILDL